MDLTAIQMFRPEYPFWQHIFTIPDGRIAFGSAQDGRLLAVFPSTGDWVRDGVWEDQALNRVPERTNTSQAARCAARRARSSAVAGHWPAREQPDARDVPHTERAALRRLSSRNGAGSTSALAYRAEVGLAQAILESGLDGRARSRARAIGFCQFLSRNWAFLNKLTPVVVLEAYNQTTQAPVLRCLPVDPCHDVRQLHSGAFGTSRRRRQRRDGRDQRRAAGWHGLPRAVLPRVQLRLESSEISFSDIATCSRPTDTSRLSMPRWCSATWST
jgi:hypothetical protein